MIVHRIQKPKYGNDISGKGSTLAGGRWHPPGSLPVLYTASNRSLAILEVLVHLPAPLIVLPKLILLDVFVPDKKVLQIDEGDLPASWKLRGYHKTVQEWGMEWLRSRRSLAISVPSVISTDFTVLINPLHADFSHVHVHRELRGFIIDDRLI
jgi:RES domain-containing protein